VKEAKELKFKILPKVHSFTDGAGVTHYPGEIVDLPPSYKGETWLNEVEKKSEEKVPEMKIEPATEPVPEASEPKKSKKTK